MSTSALSPLQALAALRDYWRHIDGADARANAEALAIAEGLLDRATPLPTLVVCGPTQAGKSTLTNALLEQTCASVSPLAAHTVQVHGYVCAHPVDEQVAPNALRTRYQCWQQTPEREELDTYVLSAGGSAPPARVLWDTPDFDSIEAASYAGPLCHLLGAADQVLVVVSQEKYGDFSVWSWIKTLTQFGLSLHLVINKLDEQARQPVLAAVQEQLARHKLSQQVTCFTLPRQPSAQFAPQLAQLKSALAAPPRKPSQPDWPNLAQPWLAPLREIEQRRKTWDNQVRNALTQALQREHDALRNLGRHPAMERAQMTLLELLEIPAVARAMGYVRRVLSAPWRWISGRPEQADHAQFWSPMYSGVLDQVIGELLEHAHTDAQIKQRLLSTRQEVQNAFNVARTALLDAIDQDSQQAALRLHNQLKTQPTLLNSLRTLRLGLDGGAVVAAIKLGGIGAVEVLLAPVMLSVSQKLTESALGTYVDRESERLSTNTEQVANTRFTQLLLPILGALAEPHGSLDQALRQSLLNHPLWQADPT